MPCPVAVDVHLLVFRALETAPNRQRRQRGCDTREHLSVKECGVGDVLELFLIVVLANQLVEQDQQIIRLGSTGDGVGHAVDTVSCTFNDLAHHIVRDIFEEHLDISRCVQIVAGHYYPGATRTGHARRADTRDDRVDESERLR